MKPSRSDRAGVTRATPEGHLVYAPRGLAELRLRPDLYQAELDRASVALGRLDAVGDLLPDLGVFLSMYVRKEAVLSAQIEGTQASLDDLLSREAGVGPVRSDVVDVVNYVRAVQGVMESMAETGRTEGISHRLIGAAHRALLEETRGAGMRTGAYRLIQNWVSRPGPAVVDPLSAAVYVPPEPSTVPGLMEDLLVYLNGVDETPALVRAGIGHAQFETIHPFHDGNGRLGRLLIVVLLCHRGVLRQPLLYLSAYLKANRAEYYEWLMRVRLDGDWEGWLRFFLDGVTAAATEGYETAIRVRTMLDEDRARVVAGVSGPYAADTFSLLLRHPYIDARFLIERLGCAGATAQSLLAGLVRVGVLRETTGRDRDRVYAYTRYLDALRPAAEA